MCFVNFKITIDSHIDKLNFKDYLTPDFVKPWNLRVCFNFYFKVIVVEYRPRCGNGTMDRRHIENGWRGMDGWM